jgi:hypothetical protein
LNRHVVSIASQCPVCGAATVETHVARARENGLRVSISRTCGACLFEEEYDGAELSTEARAAFGADEGVWAVYVREVGPQKIDVVRHLRTLGYKTLSEINALFISDIPLFKGVLVEGEQFSLALTKTGMRVELRRIQDA